MHIGMLGTRGARGNWSAMMDNAYAAKMRQAEQKSATVKRAAPTSQSAKNRATLAELLKNPTSQTNKNRATLAALMKK